MGIKKPDEQLVRHQRSWDTHYNHQRYHESLSNLTPADIYFGRGQTILLERERIKRDTINQRRLVAVRLRVSLSL